LPSPSVGPPTSGDPGASPPVAVPPDAIPPDTLPPLTPETRIALQARLDQLRLRYGIPGISVSIMFPGGARWIGTSGLADVATGEPVTASTGFAVASITKTFTSALVLALVEDGRIDLDATVRTYLPDLKPVGPKVTVRQLLDHTSGLRDYFYHARIDQMLLEKRGARWDLARVTRFIGKPYFQPGKGWHYSNTNYLVLGVLAETVGGAPLEDQFRDRFFEPLGLKDTWYQLDATPPSFVAHGYRFAAAGPDATPIDLTDGSAIVPFTSVVTAAAGAGGIASSASDLSRWARALYSGDVLSSQARNALVDPSATRRFRPSVPYGLGAQVIDIDGRRTYGHSGRLLGFRAALRFLPDHDLSIAVMTNQSRADPAVILRALLKIAFAPPLPTPEAASPQQPVVVP
jgi:D-alanyl-D-alanine carboxypeptidase